MTQLETVLSHYGVNGKEIEIKQGPLVKQIVFEPAPGTKIKNITSHVQDIARELKFNSLRVENIENTHYLGFETPVDQAQTIDFKQILSSEEFNSTQGELPICLGVNINGVPQFANLAKMPHLLVAGTTGSGKSVGLNTFILSLIARKSSDELKFVMIDPKRIEFSIYNNQEYMLYPVITENSQAILALENLVSEMERRYTLFEENLNRNISEYNASSANKLPYIVCVIDEFADLMSFDKKISVLVQRLAQKSRAAGIHLIMATQRPSVDVVTGVLKANFPNRLAYKVASSSDSRTIIDEAGAEDLIGRGDALFLSGDGSLKRIHGAFVSDTDIKSILSPYRAKIKPLTNVNKTKEEINERDIKPNCIIEFWCSLKKGERKTIINWFLSIIKMIIKTLISGRRK